MSKWDWLKYWYWPSCFVPMSALTWLTWLPFTQGGGSRGAQKILEVSWKSSYRPGLVTNSILFCWLFTINDRCKKYVVNKRTMKVNVSWFWWCPKTLAPSAAHLTVSSFLCTSGSNARVKLRALEGCCVSSKSPSPKGFERETREFLGGTEEKSVPPMRDHWFALQQINDFVQKGKKKKLS